MAIFYIVILSLLSLLLLFGASYLIAVILNRMGSGADGEWNAAQEPATVGDKPEYEREDRP
ncbi:hypothetical protein JQN58_03220 [Aneurinibacillus sp. BA2021]|nr:hypothetical protein [Aneurinibacillus sp. BA2021]